MKKKKNKVKEYLPLYLMMLPGLLYLLINNYLPMTGIILAFKKLNFSKGILASPWAGLDNFKFLFSSKDNVFHLPQHSITLFPVAAPPCLSSFFSPHALSRL